MIKHNLTIAFRNMWKYKSQTLISIIGLAVGFTCFALATLWIRYEMTYDSFHKSAEQMYVVYTSDQLDQNNYSRPNPHILAAYLKNTFPEIANATLLNSRKGMITVEGIQYPTLIIYADSSFLRMFDIKILEGSWDFLIPGSNKIAITREKAKQLFGNEDPIGKIINYGGSQEICAIVSGISKHSNYPFDLIAPLDITEGAILYVNTIIEILPGTDVEDFKKKLYEHDSSDDMIRRRAVKMKIKPITQMRYTDRDIEREVKFQHIFIFALSGLLVVLCSLFNFLTLFLSRFRIRQKEFALRTVCGASGGSLLTMLSVEFILTLLFAVVLGYMLTQWFYKSFLALSDIQMNLSAIYLESFMYIVGVILVSLLVFWLILLIFRKRSLNISIRQSNKNLSRKISVIAQLLISISFTFCTVVIIKQMYFLHHTTELGFSFKNRGSLMVYGENSEAFVNKMKQIPEITEIIYANGISSLLRRSGRSYNVSSWDDKTTDMKNISLGQISVSPEYIDYYKFQLVTGEMLTEADPNSLVLLNESAVKVFGWYNPVGKQFSSSRDTYTVKGVIKNVYNLAPTIAAKPVVYSKPSQSEGTSYSIYSNGMWIDGRPVLFKYQDGMWKSCIEKIKEIKSEFTIDSIYNAEEEYNKYLKSENTLLKLLSFVSAICILICVFGFVSLVSLTCEERRKEIAIRKINGATVGDILAIFAKEYFLLLMIGAVIAFSAGYYIMQRWLENYVKQTSIPAWIYLAIILVLALVIVLCVGWQVYRASVENPAEVVKGS